MFKFWWFYSTEKLFFPKKMLIKRKQKIKKISHIAFEKIISHIISQNFGKIALNPKELELLE